MLNSELKERLLGAKSTTLKSSMLSAKARIETGRKRGARHRVNERVGVGLMIYAPFSM